SSALTMSQRKVVLAISFKSLIRPSGTFSRGAGEGSSCSGLFGHLVGLLDGFLDAADHVERLLRQVVVLALDDALEAADGVLERDVLARGAGEHFGDVERLAEEALDLAGAGHGLRSEERRVGRGGRWRREEVQCAKTA